MNECKAARTVVVGFDPSLTCAGIYSDGRAELIKTQPKDDENYFQSLRRRADEIGTAVWRFCMESYNPLQENLLFACESPSLNAGSSNHLFEVGWLMEHLEYILGKLDGVAIIYVPPTTLKKVVAGSGSALKKHTKECGTIKHLKKGDKTLRCVPCIVNEQYGVSFEKDSGADKVHAFMLYKLGEMYRDGKYDYKPIPRRGAGKK